MTKQTLFFGAEGSDKLTLWEPRTPADTAGVIVVAHGLTECAARYEEFAQYMTGRGWAVAGFDIPGHGEALLTADGAPRPAWCGGEGSWQTAVDKLDRAVRRVRQARPRATVALLGFSLGSFLARAWLVQQTGPLPVDRLVLAGTGDQPAWVLRPVRSVIRGQCRRHGEYNSTPLVQSIAFGSYNRRIRGAASPYAWLLRDPAALAAYERDPHVCKEITGGLFRELLSCMIYVSTHETPRPCALPTLFVSGDEDPVGDGGKGVGRAARKFPGAAVRLVPGRHDILHDAGREAVFDVILDWLA